jgi:FkbM family methyltransferase
VFVEAGANDGYTLSNTYALERKGWTGLLIEAIPDLAAECQALRKKAQTVNCALVEPGYPDSHVTMTYSDVCSLVKGTNPDREARIQTGINTPYDVRVPARTLDQVLQETGINHVDLLSLDLEGYEPQALQGLDLERWASDWILIEVAHGDGQPHIEMTLDGRYELVGRVTPEDLLFRLR